MTWRSLALRVPLIKHSIRNLIRQWYDRGNRDFIMGDVVLEAPKPPISRSVRKSLRRNKYETAESYLVRHLVRPGDAVLDLGSGLGLTSILAAKASGGGRVVGYEADPRIARLAEINVRKNGVQVEIRNRAIAKTKGVCEFHVRPSFPASSLFPANGSKRIRIEADAFQDVVDEVQPTVLVCDIEGMETQVLVSANLPSVHRLMVEVHPKVTGLLGALQCVQSLAAVGFHLIDTLCFEEVLVFDRDGSASSIEPFTPDRYAGKKTTPFRETDMA